MTGKDLYDYLKKFGEANIAKVNLYVNVHGVLEPLQAVEYTYAEPMGHPWEGTMQKVSEDHPNAEGVIALSFVDYAKE